MVEVTEKKQEELYATAVEVDGIRRTLDLFMKEQKQQNDSITESLDEIRQLLTKPPVSVFPEDKGSTIKGKGVPKTHPPPPIGHTHRSIHMGSNSVMAHIYDPHASTRVRHMHSDPFEWSRRAQGHEYVQKDHIFDEPGLEDCPWDEQELLAFYDLALQDHTNTINPTQHQYQTPPYSADSQQFCASPSYSPLWPTHACAA